MSIECFEEYGKYVMITGVRDAKISHPEAVLRQLRQISGGVDAQILDTKSIAGKDHLRFAVLNALKAWKQGSQVSESLAIEIILYASGQRQIKNAIAFLGVTSDSRNLAVIGISSERSALEGFKARLRDVIGGEMDELILEEGDNDAVKRTFDITDVQLKTLVGRTLTEKEALTRLVIEKMALLSTQS
jgi:KEOPS complex subunit Cgi121